MNNQAQIIHCPKCGAEIEISQVLSQQLEKELRQKLESENEARLQQAVAQATQSARQISSIELKDLKNQLQERTEESLDLRKKTRELEAQRESLEDEIQQRLKLHEKQIEESLQKKLKVQLEKENALELKDLQQQIAEKECKIEQAQMLELEMRKRSRDLEDKQKELELALQRKLDENSRRVEAQVTERLVKQYADESDLKLKEKEKQIEGLRKSLEEARRKSEQGSQEIQGEALELDLEHKLRQQFSQDDIQSVVKGVRGADIIQTVVSNQLQVCGKILWEAKNTKNWTQGWIQKLKDDQLASGANLSILVSAVLPDDIRHFSHVDGVWICSIPAALPLASALREQLMQVSFARSAAKGKDEKMEMMFQYITGDEFRQRIEAIVESFDSMQLQIIKERRAMEKQWRVREKQIERIMINTTGMHGDIRGIFGSSVQTIKALELDDSTDLIENQVDD